MKGGYVIGKRLEERRDQVERGCTMSKESEEKVQIVRGCLTSKQSEEKEQGEEEAWEAVDPASGRIGIGTQGKVVLMELFRNLEPRRHTGRMTCRETRNRNSHRDSRARQNMRQNIRQTHTAPSEIPCRTVRTATATQLPASNENAWRKHRCHGFSVKG